MPSLSRRGAFDQSKSGLFKLRYANSSLSRRGALTNNGFIYFNHEIVNIKRLIFPIFKVIADFN
jgi:hypothetical protein